MCGWVGGVFSLNLTVFGAARVGKCYFLGYWKSIIVAYALYCVKGNLYIGSSS